MGCFDTIDVFMKCPYCGDFRTFDAQTKDLGSKMYYYDALSSNWFAKGKKGFLEKKFRMGMCVFKKYPLDKSAKVWKSQGERIEASATVPKEFAHLKFVSVRADCHSTECSLWSEKRDLKCQTCVSGFGRMFDGKIKIYKGMLIGDIYDIELKDKQLPKKKYGRIIDIITPSMVKK